jgi:hypothetical protein
MTDFIDPAFDRGALNSYQGYSLQGFSSGVFKISFHSTHVQRHEYYAVNPKRDLEAYRRQRDRSHLILKDHFDRVDYLWANHCWDKIFRVHRKGNPNETADNAHILASWRRQRVVLLFGTLEHEWELPLPVVHSLRAATGPRKGAASVFHEYMAAYQHDWVPAVFKEADYKRGYRNPADRVFEGGVSFDF